MTTTTQIGSRIDCNSCGTQFWMTEWLEAQRRKDGITFYCPNGHSLWYGESEAQKLKRELKNTKANEEWERTHREAAERSLVATKGHVTRLRRKVLAGECPFCGQHLRDLDRHVARQHADEKAETATVAE